MTKQEALDYVREHLTALWANPNIYEDGSHHIISALENIVVPMLVDAIKCEETLNDILDKDPHAFDRVNVLSPDELKRALNLPDNYRFDPSYAIDEKGNTRIIELSLMCDPFGNLESVTEVKP